MKKKNSTNFQLLQENHPTPLSSFGFLFMLPFVRFKFSLSLIWHKVATMEHSVRTELTNGQEDRFANEPFTEAFQFAFSYAKSTEKEVKDPSVSQ